MDKKGLDKMQRDEEVLAALGKKLASFLGISDHNLGAIACRCLAFCYCSDVVVTDLLQSPFVLVRGTAGNGSNSVCASD